MKIQVNGGEIVNVTENNLVVRDEKLFNLDTKQFEGVDGDLVEIRQPGIIRRGSVDGYTNGKAIKFRGQDFVHNIGENDILKIEHLFSCQELLNDIY